MRPETTLFYDVDTQRDFILPGGKLYVSGAERLIPALVALTSLARRLSIRIVASVDRHFPDDPELKRNGGEFPDHCMDGTEGQRKIDATLPRNPRYIRSSELTPDEIDAALAHPGKLVLEKQRFDVFSGNRNARLILERLLKAYRDVVVYGVYTEVCVDQALTGLCALGPKIHVVTDAIGHLGSEAPAFMKKWAANGVELISLDELRSRLGA